MLGWPDQLFVSWAEKQLNSWRPSSTWGHCCMHERSFLWREVRRTKENSLMCFSSRLSVLFNASAFGLSQNSAANHQKKVCVWVTRKCWKCRRADQICDSFLFFFLCLENSKIYAHATTQLTGRLCKPCKQLFCRCFCPIAYNVVMFRSCDTKILYDDSRRIALEKKYTFVAN